MSARSDGTGAVWLDGAARQIPLECHRDARGCLLPLDFAALPFAPQRVFTVSAVNAGTQRGGHAHRANRQLLVCVTGRIDVTLRRGGEACDVPLTAGGPGLLIETGVWASQTYVSSDSVLLVLADAPFDADDYLDAEP